MTTQYLVRVDVLPDETPHNTAVVGTYSNGDLSVLVAQAVPEFGTIVGEWNEDGTAVQEPTADYAEIRPLGNDPDGKATDELRYAYPAGWEQRWWQETALYPDENAPFGLETRYWNNNYPVPWDQEIGVRVEVVRDRVLADTTNYAIGFYSDAECTSYLYTTGAFQLGPSEWQFEEDGTTPKTVYYTITPAGRGDDEEVPYHMALLLGSAQEGHASIYPGDERLLFNYWEHDLNGDVGGWEATGATVEGMAGTATLVSDTDPFSVGDLVRIEGFEMTVTSITPGSWLALDPYRVSTTGSPIERWNGPIPVTASGETVTHEGRKVTHG